MREFCEVADLKDIEARVQNNWMNKKRVRQRLHEAVVGDDGRKNRLAPWMQKVQSKKHNLPQINLEENRIKVIETRVKKEIFSDKYEYRKYLADKQREELAQMMTEQQGSSPVEEAEANSSLLP